MSILIKGVEMPECDNALTLVIFRDGSVYQYGVITRSLIRTKGAQAVPVPTPHGRLVEIDALSDVMYHEAFETDTPLQKWDSGCWIRYKMFEHARDNAPTVIESEE